jgi:hypothetical protein
MLGASSSIFKRKFQLRGNNSMCAGAFPLLRGRTPAQLRGNIYGLLMIFTETLTIKSPINGTETLGGHKQVET